MANYLINTPLKNDEIKSLLTALNEAPLSNYSDSVVYDEVYALITEGYANDVDDKAELEELFRKALYFADIRRLIVLVIDDHLRGGIVQERVLYKQDMTERQQAGFPPLPEKFRPCFGQENYNYV